MITEYTDNTIDDIADNNADDIAEDIADNNYDTIDEYEIKREIHRLEDRLLYNKNILFLYRLSKLYKKSSNISDIDIDVDPVNLTWSIQYNHRSNNYSSNYYDYNNNDEYPDKKSEICKKNTKISFGKNKKYFIKGGIAYNIYRNSSDELRIINKDYDLELDMKQQKNLIIRYSKNFDIPEYMALSVLLYISDNKWDDESIIHYLSII
jgi:hypothetical protein